jgi:MFS transporter, FHS family, L-fucose permease
MARTDIRAMGVAVTLFFMVGFLTCLNDVVSPHLKSIFGLNYRQTQYIPFCFFSSYFVFSYPGGQLVKRLGDKKTMVSGLFVMALGALGFLLAANLAAFSVFLAALVVLAAGRTVVQVAANPYVTTIGPSRTASSRLNLAHAFNSLGTAIAPLIGTQLILKHASETITTEQLQSMSEVARQAYRELQVSTIRMPYLLIALLLILLALSLAAIKLGITKINAPETQASGSTALEPGRLPSIWTKKWAVLGAIGIFTYVGAEVSIGNLLINYMGLSDIAGLREDIAGHFLTYYWSGAMIGRFIGSALLQKLNTGILLGLAAVGAFSLVSLCLLTHGHIAMYSMLAVGLCNSIMFPSIFTLGIEGLGPLTNKGASLLIAAIWGGALIPLAQGTLADRIGLHPSFGLPAICYVYIGLFGFLNLKRHNSIGIPIPVEPI